MKATCIERNSNGRRKIGSPGRTRTSDKLINSQPLYQLSYRGTVPKSGQRILQEAAEQVNSFMINKLLSIMYL